MEKCEGKTFSVLLFQWKIKFNNLPSHFYIKKKPPNKNKNLHGDMFHAVKC